ncbi:Heat shock protein 70 family, partial [Dillenia turbinata]
VIRRKSVIPAKKYATCTTSDDNKIIVVFTTNNLYDFQVYQGERSLAKDCHELGTFSSTGIQRSPREVPNSEVTLEIEANGTPRDIERMVRDTEQFAEEDSIARERIDSKYELEAYLYDMKSSCADQAKLTKNV